jgi:hypothetical protein
MVAEAFRTWPRRALVAALVLLGGVPAGALGFSSIGSKAKRHHLDAYVRPLEPRAGQRATIRIADRGRGGAFDATVCLTAPAGAPACQDAHAPARRGRAKLRFDVPKPGLWKLTVKTSFGKPLHRPVRVRGARDLLTMLATGDSMIQYVDTALARRLESGGDAHVRSDARISTGISKPSLLNWVVHARSQAKGIRPDVTVVFIGANDGFPMRVRGHRKARCCGRAWVKAYATRAHTMMASYARRGASEVCWLTLPTPRSSSWAHIYRAVNAALRRAAKPFGDDVRLIDIAKVFTPHGRFRAAMSWHGKRVVVRQPDGVHLSVAGAGIAAELVLQALRADHAFG